MKTTDKSPAGVTSAIASSDAESFRNRPVATKLSRKAIFKEKRSVYTEKRILLRRELSDRRVDIRFEQDRRERKFRRKNEVVWS